MADPGYRWRDGHPQRRKMFASRLANDGPIQCGCEGECHEHEGRCLVVIHDGDEWHLGHHHGGVKAGDDGADSRPWCPSCNLRAAAWVTNHPVVASRDWWGGGSESL